MVIIFLGPPAAGKGTQGKKLVRFLSAQHLSTGDMLRDMREQPTELGQRVAEFMDAGKLVSDEIVLDVVRHRLEISGNVNYLFDGFPRTLSQADTLDEMLAEIDAQVDAVVGIFVPDEVLIERAVKRGQEENRADDTPETVARRLEIYHQQTEPLVSYYSERGLVHQVDGLGTIEEVFQRILGAIEGR
jgi:adenylate kinase